MGVPVRTVPAPDIRLSVEQARVQVTAFAETMTTRRSIRDFSDEPVAIDLITTAIRAAGTAPSAPYLIVVMEVHKGPSTPRPYYVKESVGIAVGLLLAALRHAGLATLTHTPSPMGFLGEVLQRPREERPYVLIPVGWPAHGARVPDIRRKSLEDIMTLIGDPPR